jgi:Predicted AAA-ATPase
MQQLFEGKQELFKGLWIEDKWDWSKTYPVLRFSLDAIEHEVPLEEALRDVENKNLPNFATNYTNFH